MKNQQSLKTLKTRKFLMVLPLLVLPFVTMAFWAFDGGKGGKTLASAKEQPKGFNTDLPQAKFNPDEKQDKFSVYEISAKSSEGSASVSNMEQVAFSDPNGSTVDPNEQKINEKLALINTELSKPATSYRSGSSSKSYSSSTKSASMNADVSRLENLMQSLESNGADDKEMAQLNTVLEKILEIQNPGRSKEKIKEKSVSSRGGINAVYVEDGKPTIFSLASKLNGRYAKVASNTIQATIHQDQDIVSGSVVKLRLLDTINVNGIQIPKNEFIYGIASINDERLKIEIASLRFRNSILPVSLSAFDLDGLEGLYIPGAISRDASKKGVDDAIQSLQIMTMDPSVSAQVAGAGIQAAKGLFGRKVKQVRVKVKAGYRLLLKDNSQKN
jgi:conjugative transposon TraM protein